MLDIIILESISTVMLIVLTISFWKCIDVPEKIFGIFLILLMLILVAKNSVDYIADPHHNERPTLEDVHNGTAIIKNDTIIKKSVYWNDELVKKN